MNGPYPLVVITPTDDFEVRLRRYAEHPKRYQNAEVVVGTETHADWPWLGKGTFPTETYPATDPRWPTHSASGYAFTPDDTFQVKHERIWLHPDGRRFTLAHAPAGACYEAPRDWEYAHEFTCAAYDALGGVRGTYWICLPDGTWWCPDQVASNGGGSSGWAVTGTLPRISVTPSIASSGYHGWVGVNGTEPGFLSADLDGRPF